MEVLAVDLETFPIRKGLAAPPAVCAGWARVVDGVVLERGLVTANGECAGDVFAGMRGEASVGNLIRAFAAYARTQGPQAVRLVNQNIVFDFAVACADDEDLIDLIFDLYDEGFIEDVMLREQLMDIALGTLGWSRRRRTAKGTSRKRSYDLAEFAEEYLQVSLDKLTWRTGYARLANVPLAKWPQGAIDYAIVDAECAGRIWFCQRDAAIDEGSEDGEIPDSVNQARYHWGLHLASVWGIRTDPAAVFALKTVLLRAKAVLSSVLAQVVVPVAAGEGDCEHTFVVAKTVAAQGNRYCTTCGAEHQPFLRGPKRNGKFSKNKKAITAAILSLCERPEAEGYEHPLTDKGVELAKRDLLRDEDRHKYVSQKAEHIEELLSLFVSETPDDVDGALEFCRQITEEGRVPDELDGLTLLSWYAGVEKLLTTYMPALESGTRVPINARYRPLVETGRASCSNPNLMNLPKAPGVRECYVPRPGHLLCSVDYEALELHTLAQVCLTILGESALAEALNNGLDPHLLLATEWLLDGVTYEEGKKIRKDETHPRHKEVEKARNMAKAANFGLPGGLGAKKFADFCKASGIPLSLEEAQQLKDAWLKQWPEMRRYFAYIKSLLEVPEDAVEDENGQLPSYATIEQVGSGRIRGRTRYTAACNSPFQGLASDGAKLGVYELAKACYRSDGSLRGSRLLVFVHDETIMEHPDTSREDRHRRCMEQSRIMVECMNVFTPDVPSKAEPALMPRWYKAAKAKYDEDGFLVPWAPQEVAA